jgi:hypothetical protein
LSSLKTHSILLLRRARLGLRYLRKRGSGKRKRLKMMFDVYEHGDVRVEIPAKKGHWNQLTQSCSLRAAFFGANMQVIRIEPGEREICDFRSDPLPGESVCD